MHAIDFSQIARDRWEPPLGTASFNQRIPGEQPGEHLRVETTFDE
jgi:hypothetical protein